MINMKKQMDVEDKFAVERPQTYAFNFLGKNTFPVLLYIGPTSEYFCEYEGCTVNSLITDEVFRELSEMGVNVICGHDENHETIVKILNFCEKYRMVYLPRYNTRGFGFYDSQKKDVVVYDDLSKEEKRKAEQEFIQFINL